MAGRLPAPLPSHLLCEVDANIQATEVEVTIHRKDYYVTVRSAVGTDKAVILKAAFNTILEHIKTE